MLTHQKYKKCIKHCNMLVVLLYFLMVSVSMECWLVRAHSIVSLVHTFSFFKSIFLLVYNTFLCFPIFITFYFSICHIIRNFVYFVDNCLFAVFCWFGYLSNLSRNHQKWFNVIIIICLFRKEKPILSPFLYLFVYRINKNRWINDHLYHCAAAERNKLSFRSFRWCI